MKVEYYIIKVLGVKHRWIILPILKWMNNRKQLASCNNMQNKMRDFNIYHSIGKDRFQEIEDQYREYVGFVEANSLEKAFEYAQNDHIDWAMNEVRSTSVGDVI